MVSGLDFALRYLHTEKKWCSNCLMEKEGYLGEVIPMYNTSPSGDWTIKVDMNKIRSMCAYCGMVYMRKLVKDPLLVGIDWQKK